MISGKKNRIFFKIQLQIKIEIFTFRSSRPLLVKDHLYGTPIKSLIFHSTQDQVISLDAKAVKIWDRLTGQPYTSIGNLL